MGRIGSVDDIASMVAMPVSPRGRYTTGTAIAVDGGFRRAHLATAVIQAPTVVGQA